MEKEETDGIENLFQLEIVEGDELYACNICNERFENNNEMKKNIQTDDYYLTTNISNMIVWILSVITMRRMVKMMKPFWPSLMMTEISDDEKLPGPKGLYCFLLVKRLKGAQTVKCGVFFFTNLSDVLKYIY